MENSLGDSNTLRRMSVRVVCSKKNYPACLAYIKIMDFKIKN